MTELNLNYNVKKKPRCVVQFEIELPWEEVKPKLDNIFNDIRKNVRMDGFRKGKVPLNVVKEKYTYDARAEFVRQNVPEILADILKEEEINPVTTPQIEDYKFNEDKNLTLKVKTEVPPEFKLKKYKKLKIYKVVHEISDKDVEETLDTLRNRNASMEIKDGPAEKGDFALTHMQVFMDGEEVGLGFPRERLIEVGEDGFLPGLGDQLEGLKKGDTKEFTYKFPEDYYKDELKNKETEFKIEIKEVKSKNVPDIEEIAESMGIENADKLREDVKKNMKAQHENRQKQDLENQIIDELVERHDFEVPKGLVEEKFKSKKEQMSSYIKNQGGDPSMLEDDKLREQAKKDVKTGMILSKIAEEEGIEVTDEDRKKEEDTLAEMYNIDDREQIKKYINDNKILTDKIFEFLKDNAKIKTKKPDK